MPAIRLDTVSKRYTLRHDRPRSFQELFLNVLRGKRSPSREKFWVLRDVSFEIAQGEMVGIIGDNGAGKSTLLKLMARIIEPTSGQIQTHGRLGALLEIGAGFHPELTGRENVYLNGAFLGLSRSQMRRLFDEIVAFSEMERFIDVQVKHYSSGMYMRLGFSVAIHLEPQILLVDEVLAVGDQAFRLRCLDRISEMKRQGVTILLVTHDLRSVRAMCDRAIWLDLGQVQAAGTVEQVIEEYMIQVLDSDQETLLSSEAKTRTASPARWGTRDVEIVDVEFLDDQGRARRTFKTGQTFIARLHYRTDRSVDHPLFGVAFHHSSGFHLSGPNTGSSEYQIGTVSGEGYIDFAVPSLSLLEGTYLFSAAVYDQDGIHPYDHHSMAYTLRVTRREAIPEEHGVVRIQGTWNLCESPATPAGMILEEPML